jgi:hypothetical protein
MKKYLKFLLLALFIVGCTSLKSVHNEKFLLIQDILSRNAIDETIFQDSIYFNEYTIKKNNKKSQSIFTEDINKCYLNNYEIDCIFQRLGFRKVKLATDVMNVSGEPIQTVSSFLSAYLNNLKNPLFIKYSFWQV